MVYIFISDSTAFKEGIIKKFTDFLQTDNRNWKRPIFYIDMSEYPDEYKVETFIALIRLLDSRQCDCVVNADVYYMNNRHLFLEKLGTSATEIQLVNQRTQQHIDANIILDISKTTVPIIYAQLIKHFKR
jgi:hypothetical protein